ncbi:MAG TPA: hypothetical protein GX695_05210 [Acholeplasmataceae bacterium]|nr:hypothetical protein [Acholeplasmataceae bacterium]
MKLIFRNFYVRIYSLFFLIAIATIFSFVFAKETIFFESGIHNLYVIIILYGGIIPFITIKRKLISQTKFGITRKKTFMNNTFAYLLISSFFIFYELFIFIMQYAFDYVYFLDMNLLINVALSFFIIATYGEIVGLSYFNEYIKIGFIILLAVILLLLYYFLQNFITNILLIIIAFILFYVSLKTYKNYLVKE